MSRQVFGELEQHINALNDALGHLTWSIEAMPDEEAGRAFADRLHDQAEDLAALCQEALAHAASARRARKTATLLDRLASMQQGLNALQHRFDQAFRYPEAVHDLRLFEEEHPDWQGWVEGVRDASDKVPEHLERAERSLEACFRELADSDVDMTTERVPDEGPQQDEPDEAYFDEPVEELSEEDDMSEQQSAYAAMPADELRRAVRAIPQIASQLTASEANCARPSRASGDTDLQQIIDNALISVLGRRVTRTPNEFLDALTRVYVAVDTNGSTRYERTLQPFQVQSGVGVGLFGAQASLYERGRQTLETVLRLLQQLHPLLCCSDQEEVDALRSLVRSQMIELVDELGLPGGPRVLRVDRILASLAGEPGAEAPDPCAEPERAVSLLDLLQVQFGLCAEHVITVEEEETLTNFLMIRDHIDGLYAAWLSFRDSLLRADGALLGTQLVRLGRTFSVIDESVQQVIEAMDGSFLGPMERQVVTFEFSPPGQRDRQSILIGDALDWAERTAREGPTQIQEAGRRAAPVIYDNAVQLQAVLAGMRDAGASDNPPHPGLSTERVRLGLEELISYFAQLQVLTEPLLPPDEE